MSAEPTYQDFVRAARGLRQLIAHLERELPTLDDEYDRHFAESGLLGARLLLDEVMDGRVVPRWVVRPCDELPTRQAARRRAEHERAKR